MAKRHSDAVAIQGGACNPSGIAHSIVEACKEIREEPGHPGTAQGDPAVRLMVHQLAFICGVIETTADLVGPFSYHRCFDECVRLSGGKSGV